ncbi:MAG: hypothetical protein ABR613_09345 [Actinomycetota bacterium]
MRLKHALAGALVMPLLFASIALAQGAERGTASIPGGFSPVGRDGVPCEPRECREIHDRHEHNDDLVEMTQFVADNETSDSSLPKMPCYNSAKGAYYIVNVYAWADPAVGGLNDRSATEIANIRKKVQRADYRLDQSAGEQDQHYRVLCVSGIIDVWKMKIDPSKDGSAGTISKYDVRKTGFDSGHTNRSYIYFYWIDNDNAKAPIGGGSFTCFGGNGAGAPGNDTSSTYGVRMPVDTRGGNNWVAYTFGHESTHAFDAVNPRAPHGIERSHCNDAWVSGTETHHDLMCYNDGSADYTTGRVTTCATQKEWFVDCNKDDYWKPGSGAPTYIADETGSLTVFNTARSIWLSSICSEATAEEPLSCQVADGRTN